MYNEQLPRLTQQLPGTSIHGSSGMADNELTTGRPYGGTAILPPHDVIVGIP